MQPRLDFQDATAFGANPLAIKLASLTNGLTSPLRPFLGRGGVAIPYPFKVPYKRVYGV